VSETIQPTSLDGVRVITTRRFEDSRGFFSEVFREDRFTDAGIGFRCVQDNHVLSDRALTLRGIHYQLPPFAQAKLVRVIAGSALDVAVDLRRGSPTFGKWVAVTLRASDWSQVFVPAGFGHATLSLEPGTEFIYKVSAPYAPTHERGIRFDDPEIGVEWGVPPERVVASERDRRLPTLREQPDLPAFESST
jgi:dTDP-4-dehydrorhamnose 3,5-epimerase